jgi:hypothetical protein
MGLWSEGGFDALSDTRGSGAFIVWLEFTEVEVRGGLLPFYADLLRIDKNPLIQPTLSERVLVRGELSLSAQRAVGCGTLPPGAGRSGNVEVYAAPPKYRPHSSGSRFRPTIRRAIGSES